MLFLLRMSMLNTKYTESKQTEKNAFMSAHASTFKDTFDSKCKMIAPQFEPIMACMIEAIRSATLTSEACLTLCLSHDLTLRVQPSCL